MGREQGADLGLFCELENDGRWEKSVSSDGGLWFNARDV